MIRGKQVWRTDSTSLRRPGGVLSRGAVLEGFRRYVLSWAVSLTRAVGGWLEAVAQARGGARPDIFHTDQGAQFPSQDFTARLAAAGSQSSMDGRGRALDHVLVERWWRTVKDEEGYGQDDEPPREALQGVETFVGRDNERRQPQALADQTPAAVYFSESVEQSIFIITLCCLDDGVRFIG